MIQFYYRNCLPYFTNGFNFFQPVAVRLSPESPVVQSSDVDEDESEQQRLKMHRRLHGVGTRDVGYEQVQNYLKIWYPWLFPWSFVDFKLNVFKQACKMSVQFSLVIRGFVIREIFWEPQPPWITRENCFCKKKRFPHIVFTIND